MSQLIQFRRGGVANLPASAALGEPLFATDTNQLFVGTGSGVALVTGTDEKVKVGAAGTGDYLNESYFEQDETNHIRIKQNTLLAGVDADKVDGKNVDDAQVSTDYLWTAGKIKSYVDGLINGLDWQESVLDRDLATPPVEPTTGDRYIVAATATDAWVGQEGNITEWDGTEWIFIAPNEGNSLRVEDEDAQLVHNGTAWVKFGTTTTHNETAGLQGGAEGDYYHLTNVQHDGLTNAGTTTLHKHDVDTAELVDDSVTAAKLNADTAGDALVQNVATGALDVNTDGSTLETSADALRVKDLGITTAKLADDAVTAAKINADVAGVGIVQNATSGALDIDAVDADVVTVSNLEVDNLKTGVLDIDLSEVSTSDDTLASAKAIKSYVDGEITTAGSALTTHEADTSTHGVTEIVGASEAQTLTNKTIDASLNTIFNLDVADFDATAIETSADTLTDTDSAIPTSAAVKDYVDAVAQGLAVHAPARLATTEALTATYDNGTSGVGATLTNSGTQAAFTLDSTAVTVGDRILVKNQANGFENGIYEVTTVGDGTTNWVLTRSSDFDNSPNQEIHDGDFFFVTEGTVNGDNGFVQTEISPLTIGTDSISFVQFSGAGQITAGDGLAKSGNILSVNTDDSTLEISADALRVKDLGITTAKLADDAVTAAKINADVAGDGLVQNVTTGALDINVAQTMQISSDAIAVKYQTTNSITVSEDESGLKADINTQNSSSVTLSVDASGLKSDVNVDDTSIKIDAVNNYIYVDAIDGGTF